MGLRAMWFSAVTGVLGAILGQNFDQRLGGVDLDLVALILMICGAVGLAISCIVWVLSLRGHERGIGRPTHLSRLATTARAVPVSNRLVNATSEAQPVH